MFIFKTKFGNQTKKKEKKEKEKMCAVIVKSKKRY